MNGSAKQRGSATGSRVAWVDAYLNGEREDGLRFRLSGQFEYGPVSATLSRDGLWVGKVSAPTLVELQAKVEAFVEPASEEEPVQMVLGWPVRQDRPVVSIDNVEQVEVVSLNGWVLA